MLSVSGPDSTSILQDLILNDMDLFDRDGPSRAAIYTGISSSKGQMLYDAMIIKPKLAGQTPENTEYWVDLHKYDALDFMNHV